MNKNIFVEEIKKLNISLTEKQLLNLDRYYKILVEENKKINLTAITEEQDVYLKHFYDSLTLSKVINLNEYNDLCDIGTGAGFPGLVLKIVFPNLSIVLVDSLQKRVDFLNKVIKELELKNIKAVHSRIEDYKDKEKFDIVVTRAVSKTNIILELGCQLPKINGYFILMKANVEEELKEAETTIKELSYKVIKKEEFLLPYENSRRNIVVLKKFNSTNKKYPREFSKIKKNTL